MKQAALHAPFDILIVGAGLAGLTLANLLALGAGSVVRPLRLGVIDARPPLPAVDPQQALRVSALAPSSRLILQRIGVWDELSPAQRGPYERMRVWQGPDGPAGSHALDFAAAEFGVPELGHIVGDAGLRWLLWQAAERAGVKMFGGLPPIALQCEPHAVAIELPQEQLSTALLVGADGGDSWVRQQLGIAFRERKYGQMALVVHMATGRPHEQTAWQRFLPTGPVALLPLADGRSSLVWSCAGQQSRELLAATEADFAAQVATAVGHSLGDMECTTPRAAFPLTAGLAATTAGRRFALIGDAAHRVHPLAGQGINLGLLDAAVLADELLCHMARPGADPGDPRTLRRYARRRATHTRVVLETTDALNRMFQGVGNAAGAGMGLLQWLTPVRRRLARYAMGLDRIHGSAPQPLPDSLNRG